MRNVILIAMLPGVVAAQVTSLPPRELPEKAATHLVQSLDAAREHPSHVWRDTKPINDDGTVNAYVEIPRGEVRKFEFDMRANARAIDRVMPPEIGGYPVNYGFVPQTVSYDGDPFDALVLGPPLEGGALMRGTIVGVMFMEDEKGLDSKVVKVSGWGSAAEGLAFITTTHAFFRACRESHAGSCVITPKVQDEGSGRVHLHGDVAFRRDH